MYRYFSIGECDQTLAVILRMNNKVVDIIIFKLLPKLDNYRGLNSHMRRSRLKGTWEESGGKCRREGIRQFPTEGEESAVFFKTSWMRVCVFPQAEANISCIKWADRSLPITTTGGLGRRRRKTGGTVSFPTVYKMQHVTCMLFCAHTTQQNYSHRNAFSTLNFTPQN